MDLFILDNGQQYSDRKTYFVEDPGYSRVQVEALLKLLDGPSHYTEFKVLGHGALNWFEGKVTTFPALIEQLDWHLDSWNDEERFAGRRYAMQLPLVLLALMPRFLRERWYAGAPEKEGIDG